MNEFTTLQYEDLHPAPLGRYSMRLERQAIATWKEIVGERDGPAVPMSFAPTWMLHALRLALGGIPAGGILARHELRFDREPQSDAVIDTEVAIQSVYEKRGRTYVALKFVSTMEGEVTAEDVMHLIWPRGEGGLEPARPTRAATEEIDGEELLEGLISQEQIDRYAAVTGDYNPLHVDSAAAAASPFRSTIAHGPIPLGYLFRGIEVVHDRHWVPGLSLDARFVGPARPGDRFAVVRIAPSEFGVVRGDGHVLVVAHVTGERVQA